MKRILACILVVCAVFTGCTGVDTGEARAQQAAEALLTCPAEGVSDYIAQGEADDEALEKLLTARFDAEAFTEQGLQSTIRQQAGAWLLDGICAVADAEIEPVRAETKRESDTLCLVTVRAAVKLPTETQELDVRLRVQLDAETGKISAVNFVEGDLEALRAILQ